MTFNEWWTKTYRSGFPEHSGGTSEKWARIGWEAAVTGWQPIDTAPKDGTEIDVWTQLDGRIPWVYWDDEWISKYFKWFGKPTHWMQLPDPPKE